MAFTHAPELVPLLHPRSTQCQQRRGSGVHETTQGHDQTHEGQLVGRGNQSSSNDDATWSQCPGRTRHPLDRRGEQCRITDTQCPILSHMQISHAERLYNVYSSGSYPQLIQSKALRLVICCRAVASGPTGPVLAGPLFVTKSFPEKVHSSPSWTVGACYGTANTR